MFSIFLKTLVWASILFGCPMGVYIFIASFSKSPDFLYCLLKAIVGGVFSGGLYGISFSVILTPIHYYFFRRAIDPKFKPVTFDARQFYTLDIEADFNSVFEHSLKILENTRGLTIENIDRETGHIQAKTTKSFKCFGERLKLKIHALEQGKVNISLSSFPLGRLTLLDYGKNYENIRNYLQRLNSIFSKDKFNTVLK